MHKKDLKKLALLGLTAGLVMAVQPGNVAAQDNAINAENLLAKPNCGSHGCGGGVAERDVPAAATDHDDEDMNDEDTDEEELKEMQKKDESKADTLKS